MFKYLEALKQYSDMCIFRFLNGDDSFEISYKQYLEGIRKCAYKLESLAGSIEGMHIGVIGSINYEYMVVMAAVMFSRAVYVPINYRETESNMLYAANTAELDLLIVDDKDKYDFIKNVDCISFDEATKDALLEKELSDFSDDESEKMIMMLFTSGTTSLAKGVALSVGSVFGDEKIVLHEKRTNGYKTVPGMRVYSNYPLYHVGGILGWLAWTEHGCTIVRSLNPQNILTDLENERIDAASVNPATVKLWLKSIRRGHVERLGGAKLIMTGGAPLSVDDVKEIQSHGIDIGQVYGMTETGGSVTSNFDMANHITSVGRAHEGVDIQIIDGEICIRHSGNMMGYYNNEEETALCLEGGMIHTGDLGYLDDEGYLYITGRKKNLIILSGGENVSPEELEALLYKNKDVKECKAYEKDDRIYMDVYASESNRDSIKEYIGDLNKTLPIYKRIHSIEFQSEELAKTASGKIKR